MDSMIRDIITYCKRSPHYCCEEIKALLSTEENVKQFKIYFSDTFNILDFTVYYIAVSWIDNDNNLHMTGGSYSYVKNR